MNNQQLCTKDPVDVGASCTRYKAAASSRCCWRSTSDIGCRGDDLQSSNAREPPRRHRSAMADLLTAPAFRQYYKVGHDWTFGSEKPGLHLDLTKLKKHHA